MMDHESMNNVVTELMKDLAEKGKLVEGGFAAFRLVMIPKDAPPSQINALRMAWMASADHLFASIVSILDPGQDITDKDLAKMDLIQQELDRWREEMTKAMRKTAT